MSGEVAEGVATPRRRARWRRLWLLVPLVLVLLAAGWFGVGAATRYRVDDRLDFRPAQVTPRGSQAVDMAAALLTREVDQYGWQPNDPLFYPTALIDNPSHFQSGIVWALSRFTLELFDRATRLGNNARLDEDLQRASGLLQYPGDVWVLDLRSIAPAPSEDQYRAGRDALLAYNKRLADGQATFNKRADALASMLQRISRDLGAEAASIDARLATPRFVINRSADDLFYQIKGASYAYAMLFQALAQDFAPVVSDKRLAPLWAVAGQALNEAASLRPLVVLDAAPDSALLASHPAAQGYLLLLAQARLNDLITAMQI